MNPNIDIHNNDEYNHANPLIDSVHVEPNTNRRKMGLTLEHPVISINDDIDPSIVDKYCCNNNSVVLVLVKIVGTVVVWLILHIVDNASKFSELIVAYNVDISVSAFEIVDDIFVKKSNGLEDKQSYFYL